MKEIRFSLEKNTELKTKRDVTFGELLNARFIGIEGNKNRKNQRFMLFEFKKYVWVVPYVEDKDHYFLKTAFPSRKYTKQYLGGH